MGLGLVHPDQVKRNDRAEAGDVLILSKPIGVGILSAALKKGSLSDDGYRAMIQVTTQLNTPGIKLASMAGVHALTDVTGFGLLGHLLEICRGSGLTAELDYARLPILPLANELAQKGFITGASDRNWLAYGEHVAIPDSMADWQRKLLADPQTSGGLLVACSSAVADQVLALFHESGFAATAVIGTMRSGESKVVVR